MINFSTDAERSCIRVYCPSAIVYPGHKSEKEILISIEEWVRKEMKDLLLLEHLQKNNPESFKANQKVLSLLSSILKNNSSLSIVSEFRDQGFKGYDCVIEIAM